MESQGTVHSFAWRPARIHRPTPSNCSPPCRWFAPVNRPRRRCRRSRPNLAEGKRTTGFQPVSSSGTTGWKPVPRQCAPTGTTSPIGTTNSSAKPAVSIIAKWCFRESCGCLPSKPASKFSISRAAKACFAGSCNERGAVVTGVDAAQGLIDSARQRGPDGITYLTGDARQLSFLPPDRFSAAACLLAIQNIHPIQGVFDGVARALRPNGRFVLVMMHPSFRGPKETSWGWDEAKNVQFRRVDRYLTPRKTPITTHPGKAPTATLGLSTNRLSCTSNPSPKPVC